MIDIYLYPSTNVLINKLGIKDEKLLEDRENQIVTFNFYLLLSNPYSIESVFDIKKIHHQLFSDLYEWAGQYRKINVFKSEPVLDGLSVNYSDYRNIDKELKKLDAYFKSIIWSNFSTSQIIDTLIGLISRLWRIHCFREGNTRSVVIFLYFLMKQIKLKLNIDFIGTHAKFFRNALVYASIDQYSEYEHLSTILKDSISMKDVDENKYKTIKEYEVEKYNYSNHKIKE